MATGFAWQLTAPTELQWVQWGDEWVLYHGATGDTHLLEPLSVELLQTLQRAPATAAELVEDLAHDGDGDEEMCRRLSTYIDSLIATLARFGVIERGDP